MTSPLLNQALGDIARELPGATAVFHKYKLDFCCGGAKTLAEEAARRRVPAQTIAEELAGLSRAASDEDGLANLSDTDLVEHIIHRYHDVHRQQLPELIRLSRRVESVHRDHPACPAGLAEHLETMLDELEGHMQKEEQVLFPMIARGQGARATMPIAVMRHEHDDHGQALTRMNELAHQRVLPEDACNTWRALYLSLEHFHRDLMVHIHLENNVLFTRCDGRLGSAA